MKSTKLMETITGSFGQRLTEAKRSNGTMYLSTPDGFLYAIVENPSTLTANELTTLVKTGTRDFKHVVILCPGLISQGITDEVKDRRVSIVHGERYENLMRALDIQDSPEVKPASRESSAVLPTAERLDKLMRLGAEWTGYGIPALAARFYGEASRLKPEFVPAILGLGESYLALNLPQMAQESFDRVLELHEGNVDARIGIARSHGLRGRVKREIEALEALLRETPGNIVVRAHLLAALVEVKRWEDALTHVEELLRVASGEGRFHAMKAALLHHTGRVALARKEEKLTLSLGVSGKDLERVYSSMQLEVGRTIRDKKPVKKR